MINQLTPNYLSSLVPQPVGAASRYNPRDSNSLQTIDARTNQFFHSFLPSTIRAWNRLPIKVKDSNSVNSFKNNLKPEKYQTPKHFTLVIEGRRFFIQDFGQIAAHLILTYFTKTLLSPPYAAVAV